MAISPLIISTDRGLYCPAGDFYIDAWKPVPRNVVTHAHSDHARRGSERYLVPTDGQAVLRQRLGADILVDPIEYGHSIEMNSVRLSLHPAGHLLGSAQVRVEHMGQVWVFTGDYKIQPDPTCRPFELVRCHTLITECTFGLPIFRWRPAVEIAADINAWWRQNAQRNRTSILLAYSLGKAQRALAMLDPAIGPILLHGAVHAMTETYRAAGIALPPALHANVENAKLYKGKALVIAPPGAEGGPWIRKFHPESVGVASGWMQVRGHRRRQAVDRGFVLSDHVDWPDLQSTIKDSGAEHIIATHGYTGPLVRYLRESGKSAEEFSTRFEGEDETDAVESPTEAEAAMIRFAELYAELDATTRTAEKVDALKSYFRDAPPHDAAWAAFLLLGRKFGRTVSSRLIREWAAEITGFAPWLIDECNLVAGDFSETLSLLLPPPSSTDPPTLHEVIEDHLQSLAGATAPRQRQIIVGLWDRLPSRERYVLHKLLGGAFRVGVSRLLVIRALAELAGVERALMTHRLTGNFEPSVENFAKIMSPDTLAHPIDPLLPFPFMLANALDRPAVDVGDPAQWLLEWKWDGIRAQMIRRDGRASLWSRGEEMIAGTFPDLMQDAALLPAGTVLDGEILAWNDQTHAPLPFAALQRRLNRKNVELTFWPDVPLVFMIFDLLELNGTDVRAEPLSVRRRMLRDLPIAHAPMLRISGEVAVSAWADLPGLIDQSRGKRVEGLMLKRWDSLYLPGRPVGPWWKLKVQPFTIDAILVAAQPGRGRRAGLLTDCTFAVADASGKLVTICKAYSGLTDQELVEVDRYVRRVSRERFGPVYSVPPERVYEIGFEAIQASDRHKSGIALRFPRILRQRTDKTIDQADTVESVRKMLHDYEAR